MENNTLKTIELSWEGGIVYEQLLKNSFKEYLLSEEYSDLPRAHKESTLEYHRQLLQYVHLIDSEISLSKKNSKIFKK